MKGKIESRVGGRREKEIGVLASGGVDSACLIEWARRRARRVQPIYVAFGLRWEGMERSALRRYVRAIGGGAVRAPVVLRMPAGDLYAGHWSLTGRGVPGSRSADSAVYLPGRNLLLLSKASVYCAGRGIQTIAIGTLSANPFADASASFLSAFFRLASTALGKEIRIVAPFRRQTKSRLLKSYAGLPFHLCFSCLRPKNGLACGRCNKCAEWKRAAEPNN